MAGIINTNLNKEPPQQVAGEQSSPSVEGDLSGEPTDQLDQDIEKVKLAGMAMLYDDKGHQALMQELAAGKADPAQTIANATFNLMNTLDEKSKGTIPEDALVPAAIGLLAEIGQIAAASGVLPADENTMAQALQRLVALAIEAGIITQEAIEELMADMPEEEIQQMRAQQEQIATSQPAKGGI